jgi:uncharacterized protein YjbI with pentapeptide repeats
MNEKLNQYLNGVFAPYEGVKSVAELKADLLSDLQERFRELQAEGKDDETALAMTIDSIGDIEQTIQEIANLSRSLERQVRINLNAIDMQKSDFAGVTAHAGKFEASTLRGSDFSGADLTGSLFKVSDLREANFDGANLTGSSFEVSDAREANFDGANLTDCSFSVTDLTDASFRKSILVRTNFSISGQGAKFIDVNLLDVKLTKTDLRNTIFESCIFNGVDFNLCDLRGIRFDGQTFIGVKFDKSSMKEVSFRGATLKNVSFTPPFSLTNKSYLDMKTICFDGAMMDKLTYASLKGLRVFDLSKVTVI